MATISVQNLEKSFGDTKVLHEISLGVEAGEFAVLVGPSGCGKSTLLRIIAGLETASSGTISIAGKVVNELPPKDRDIAMVFQNYALYPHFTVAENMGFSLRLQGVPKARISEKVAQAASILGLTDLLSRHPRQLSGGQRQRVAMGRAIVRDPQIFLFDEPLSNLDAKLRVQMRTEIRELHHRLKTTIVYVTHDQVEAMTMADKIVVMRNGVVEQIGKPLDLYDKPKNMFVAGFIGSPAMNFLDGTIVPAGFQTADGTVIPMATDGAAHAVTCGIRPEHFHLAPDGIEVDVVVIETTGAETLMVARLGSRTITCVLRDRIDARPGDKLKISMDTSVVHLFDGDGNRIETGKTVP